MNTDGKMLQTLMDISYISNNTRLAFKDKLQSILSEVVSCMNTEKGSIMLVKGRKKLEVAASTQPDLVGVTQPMDEDSPSSWVVKNKKLLYVDAASNKDLFAARYGHYRKDAFLLAPILSNNQVLGLLSVTEKISDDRFSPQEQEVLLNMAGHVISALENHRMAESLKRHRRSLQKKNLQLKRLEKLRTELFNMLIHDLKGPISEVMANIDILSYTVSQDDQEYVMSAQAGGDTLFRMISDLLDIARMEEGSLKLLYEKIDPEDFTKEAVSRLYGLSKARELNLVERFQSAAHKTSFIGDRAILLRVMQNLLTNAFHYSSHGQTVEVGFDYLNSGKICFFVKDNGPGVPLEFQQSIFDKFVQVSKKKDGRKYTTGLGLTFCKMAVEAHRGTIFVESDGVKGSCFKFILPLDPQKVSREMKK